MSLAAVTIFQGCDPGVPNTRTGFTRSDDGTLIVQQVLCDGERVVALRLYAMANDLVIGDDDDTLIWEVRSTSEAASTQSEFTVGRAPRGFVERTPLSALPSDDGDIGVIVDLNRGRTAGRATVGEIETGRVVQDDRAMTTSRFRTSARKSCN